MGTVRVTAYQYPDPAFGGAIVCVVPLAQLRPVLSLQEINAAFSGYVSYRRAPWMTRYVGVWGRKNCQRFRRFIRERGAEVSLVRARPSRLRLGIWVTHPVRARVRSLDRLTVTRDLN